MVRISILAIKFRVGDQKKGLWRTFTCIFCPGTKLYSRLGLGAQAEFWGVTGPKMHFSGSGLLVFGGAQSSLGGAFLAWGAQAITWGARPEIPPWDRA